MLLLGLGSCAADQGASPMASEGESPRAMLDVESPASTPPQGVITVVEVVQVPASVMGQRVVAMHLAGEVGLSAVLRSLEIRAWTEPNGGSSCAAPPIPIVLRPQHADAVQPALADQTRTVVVRSLGHPGSDAGSGSPAKFRSGPVPSLNGDFEGWVSFHVPAGSDDGFCAFDLRGVVVVVAGETTIAELPVLRIDTRVP